MVLILGLTDDKGNWFSINGNDLKSLMVSELKCKGSESSFKYEYIGLKQHRATSQKQN